ncbi:sulfurtransferase [Siminovitchia terrae]|uniref:Rhodanese-like domain-containing protein n=1 Tax=Siminovitchia terrae TaxID=1914933 RepID=A0A429X793_SIMTE|nr:rhodanese-like domain-containing protein [Siminovitchia terrae]RST59190.1 rhodanese-like domain-containing protein [Siminovitchia terrae]GIN94150.1 sulfurtransferase [Siminovitchia terrae]
MGAIAFTLFVVFIIWRMLPPRGIRQIKVDELKTMLQDKNKQFVDVRTPAEYQRNHIPGFQNIPLHMLESQANQRILKEKEIILICQSGMRSLQACRILKKKGYMKLANVRGGMNAWF